MKLTFTKLAAISAVVLTFATIDSKPASAQCRAALTAIGGGVHAQVPQDMAICATVANTFTTALTDINFGSIGVTNATGQFGCLKMAPATGTLDESNLLCTGRAAALPAMARVVSRTGTGTSGLIAITGAFPSQEIRVLLNVANQELACAGIDGATTSAPLLFGRIHTDAGTGGTGAGTPANWAFNTDLAASNTAATMGSFVTAAATGNVTIGVGAEIQNNGTNNRYVSGTCEGAFNVTLFY